MEQPPGFVARGEKMRVCRLQKSLYGLKQSPRARYTTPEELKARKEAKDD